MSNNEIKIRYWQEEIDQITQFLTILQNNATIHTTLNACIPTETLCKILDTINNRRITLENLILKTMEDEKYAHMSVSLG